MDTILLVEADLHQQQLYSSEFQDEGWQVICAASGKEALETAQSNPVDCVVLDARFPQLDGGGEFSPDHMHDYDDGEGGNGTHLLSQIRQHWPQLPVIVYTTQTVAEVGRAQKALAQCGATTCLLKNGDPSHLVTAVHSALQHASDQRMAAQQTRQMTVSPNDTNCGRNGAPVATTLDQASHHDTRVDPYQDPNYNVPG